MMNENEQECELCGSSGILRKREIPVQDDDVKTIILYLCIECRMSYDKFNKEDDCKDCKLLKN